MKRAIIVHCWEGSPEYCWYPYVKRELEKRGFLVSVPAFPDTDLPKQSEWLPYLSEQIGMPDQNLFLIGHSLGCVTILRYLEQLSFDQSVGGVVLVAGFTEGLGLNEIASFFQTPLDLEKIQSKSKNGFVAIHSDNDPYVDLKYGDIFKDKLGAEVIVKHAMGHFSGPIDNEQPCTELPDVVKAIEKLNGS